jgi:heat shock protein HslJ
VSNIDLEDELRGTLDRAAASVPPAADLTERATTGARKAQRRTWIISGAAAVAVASVAVVGFSLGGSRSTPMQPPVAGVATPTASTTVSAPSVAAVSGTWRPVQIAGVKPLTELPQEPLLVFRPDGTWRGSDGCNALGGTYTIGRHGAFTAAIGPHTLIGCNNVPNTGVLRDAKRITVDSTTLRFYDADGRQLATYTRAG